MSCWGGFLSIGALRKGLGREGRCPQDGALREGLWLFLPVSPSGDWDWGRGFRGMGVRGWVGLLGEGSGSRSRIFLLAVVLNLLLVLMLVSLILLLVLFLLIF